VMDNDAPRLTVLEPRPNQSIAAPSIEARCRTEEDASVFINGQEAEVSGAGVFMRRVALKPGLNTLVFEAVDAAGNVIYNSLLVTRTP